MKKSFSRPDGEEAASVQSSLSKSRIGIGRSTSLLQASLWAIKEVEQILRAAITVGRAVSTQVDDVHVFDHSVFDLESEEYQIVVRIADS